MKLLVAKAVVAEERNLQPGRHGRRAIKRMPKKEDKQLIIFMEGGQEIIQVPLFL